MKKLLQLAAATALISFSACTKEDLLDPEPGNSTPTVTTLTPVKVNDSVYTCGGEVKSQGSSAVVDRGVVVSLDANPSLDDPNDVRIDIGTGTGQFSTQVGPFTAGYTYHIRAYAKNNSGTSYGADLTVVPSGEEPNIGCPVVKVTGSIDAPTTWTAGNVYFVEGNIKISSVLTIQPGVIIKMKGARLEVIGSGKIIANGNESNHITFTSYADDSYCGDNNGDGNATTPQKGDWQSIYLNGGSGNSFKYCDVFYAGRSDGGYYNAVLISVSGTSFTFDHCTFAHTLSNATASTAYVFHGSSYMSDASVSVFTNNVFYDNDRPLYINGRYNLGTTNTFHNPANPSQTNTRNGIYLYGNGGDANVSYLETEVPFVEEGVNDQGVNGSLTIGPNVVVKFKVTGNGGYYHRPDRPVNLHPTAVITSYRDDSRMGDTNGDGSATAPAKGDWAGIYDTDARKYLSYSNIFYSAN